MGWAHYDHVPGKDQDLLDHPFLRPAVLLAGVLGAASSVYLAVDSPAVPENMWSPPQTQTA